jgi:hypothetical protein
MSIKYNQGDRISFIDQKMDGVVRSVKSNGKIIIETDDGFEITASPSEVILVKSNSEEKGTPLENNADEPEFLDDIDRLISITDKDTLTFITQAYEQNKVLSGKLRHVLVNNLGSSVLFTAYQKEPEVSLLAEGSIAAGRSQVIHHSERKESIVHERIVIQYQVCDPHRIIPPGKLEVSPKTPGLEDAFSSEEGNTFFCTRKTLYTDLSSEDYDLSLLVEKYEKDRLSTGAKTISRSRVKETANRTSFDKVVDLHIEELVDDLSGLTAGMMLEIQRNELIRNLNELLRSGDHKLIVIHGVGRGKLKNTVYEEVEKYPHLACAAADPRFYGSGATVVLVR